MDSGFSRFSNILSVDWNGGMGSWKAVKNIKKKTGFNKSLGA